MFKKIAVTLALAGALSVFSMPVLAHSEHCKNTELGGIMKELKSDLKTYVKAFKSNDQALMQLQLDKLIASTSKAKKEVPLKLQDMDMSDMDHTKMGDMKDMNMSNMDHTKMSDMKDMNMSDMDHSKMGDMKGMDHQSHMQHMAYNQGIDKLQALFKQLKTAKDKGEIKTVLAQVKRHSKNGHKEFRMGCA